MSLKITAKIIALLICASILGLHENPILSAIGVASLLATSLWAMVFLAVNLLQRPKINSDINKIVAPLFLLAALYFISGLLTINFINAFSRFIQLVSIACLIYLFYCAAQQEKKGSLVIYFARAFAFSASALALVVMLGVKDENIAGFKNNNVVGMWICVAGIIGLAGFKKRKYSFIYISILVFALFFGGSRTSAGAFIAGLLVYYSWPLLKNNKFIFWIVLLGLTAFSFFIIWIIVGLSVGIDLESANMVARDITNKNLLSGRDVIWPKLLELVWQKPWFGWGGGSQIGDILGTSLSAHNLFLQILVQLGFVGLAVFLYIVIVVWAVFWKYREVATINIACSTFVVVLVSQNFEVTMLQNNLALSYPMWACLGLCLGYGGDECRKLRMAKIP